MSDFNFLDGSGIRYAKDIEVNFIGATALPDVFACGDAAFDHGTVTQAIATGRQAAAAAVAYLKTRADRPS